MRTSDEPKATQRVPGPESDALDLEVIRRRLAGIRGQDYWRSLEELAETQAFRRLVQREFPAGAAEWWDGVSRRNFLKMAAASLALAGLTACTKQPVQQILPYVKQPAELVPGEPLFYATSMILGGFATGVLVKSHEGHPVKIEGNPEHPAALGRSSIWMQASILDLYDPDRSQSVAHHGEISTWEHFLADLNELAQEQEATAGKGLCFLTETVTSPTLADQLETLLKRFPAARWYQFDPVCRDNIREGARLAFGEVVESHCHFDKAAVILSLESDFLYTHPERLRYTRLFTDGRRVALGKQLMNRLHVVESSPTVTGSMADHRLPLESGDIADFTLALAHKLGALENPRAAMLPEIDQRFLNTLASDLGNHPGQSLVLAGESQPPIVHALTHLLNFKLGNVGKTIVYAEPSEARSVSQLEEMRELGQRLKAGAIDCLFILGGNPGYNFPRDVNFAQSLAKVRRSIHLSAYLDETSASCTWHIPQAHYLESWSDARSFDGTVSMCQPLIAPLYNGKSFHEVLGVFDQQQPIRSDYEIVRSFWSRQKLWDNFEKGWRKALHDGFIPGSAAARREVHIRPDHFFRLPQLASIRRRNKAELEICFRPDPNLWDGQFANNGWLQECPKPLTKLTWDNAILVSPALADRKLLKQGDVVELTIADRRLRGPVWIMPGQAENTLTLHLGYGRARAGRIGTGVGFDAHALRHTEQFWRADGVHLLKTGQHHELVSTQTHHHVEDPARQIYRSASLAAYLKDPNLIRQSVEVPERDETLYYPNEYPYAGYKWGMSIDLTTCIGCNACLVACEVENNIPVVGKDQVRRNREMFWIRVDTYYRGSLENPEFNHMPVPCMHCEHAPCELVCPVAATVHDQEGLNVQVYNRCVGTRFCSNNCPYKVRRFNFLRYTNYNLPSLKPMYNPDVTVRWRGVMEKCTYCVQRISRARIEAEKDNRRIREGEVLTACQQACPADAIIFGDLNDPDSRVRKFKASPLDYPMLGQLNTRPRTTYLARIHNPKPEEPISG